MVEIVSSNQKEGTMRKILILIATLIALLLITTPWYDEPKATPPPCPADSHCTTYTGDPYQ